MRRIAATLFALSLCAAQGSAHGTGHGHASPQQPDFAKAEIKTTKVAGGVYMLEGVGGNIGVSAGADGVLIVDDQFAPLVEKIRAALKPLSPGPLRFVLNTHFHFDHTHANPVFGREALIVAHANVRRRLTTDTVVLGQTYRPLPKEGLPVVTYETALSVHFNGEEVRVVHFPAGHTDGDSVVYFTGSNVIHMGDDFFAGRFPFVDLDNGGSVEGLTRNVAEIISKAPAGVKIIPGHGPLSTAEDLRAYHSMLVETTELIRARLRAGRTLEQAKAEGLPEKWKEWGSGFINTQDWIGIVYRSLQQNAGRKAALDLEPAPRDAASRLSFLGESPVDWRALAERAGD
ncbi:MAG TPA: MBL fold metallo-hydrolase [Pyrinomonadaceae bacterium]|jgi:glyoxylase-like metal-dependent hydrolase (beta-lactamase superfamily II)